MTPIVKSITLVANCRTCLKDFTFVVTPEVPADDLDMEMLTHETLEAEHWADSRCQECWENETSPSVGAKEMKP